MKRQYGMKLAGQSKAGVLILALFAVNGLCHAVEFTPFTGYGMGGDFTEAQSGSELELSDNSLYAFAIDFEIEFEPGDNIDSCTAKASEMARDALQQTEIEFYQQLNARESQEMPSWVTQAIMGI